MIVLQGIYKSFNGDEVLRGIDLEIPKGAITVILGPSGAGKTVLLKHIIGLLKPDRGLVEVEGVNVASLTEAQMPQFRRRFGMLFQSAALFDSLTVAENVAFPLGEHTTLAEGKITERVGKTLEMVGLAEAAHRMPAELSGGMRKRVGLARAIALEPEIILYDEPTTGLDPLMTDQINRLILDMQRRLKISSVIISHDVESTLLVADKVAMLHGGRIVAEGTPSEFEASRDPFVREFLQRRASH